MRTHYENSQERWHQIGEDVLDGVAVNGGHSDRCRPLVVLLVDVLVEVSAV